MKRFELADRVIDGGVDGRRAAARLQLAVLFFVYTDGTIQCLGTRRIPTLALLRSELRSWNARANRNWTHIDWTFTRKAARVKFGYQKTLSKRS